MKKQRESGIELLRIYAIMSVIVIHYFNGGIGGGINYIHGTIGVFISHSFLTFCFCAVDLFVMISGYFLSATNKRSLSKIAFLFFQAIIFFSIKDVLECKINSKEINSAEIIASALSIGYFIMFYSIIYIFSPIINNGLNSLCKSNGKKAVAIIFITFSIISSVVAILNSFNVLNNDWNSISTITKEGSFEGYNVVNFFVCYTIGWYIRHYHNDKMNFSKSLLGLIINSILLTIWGYIDLKSAYTYDNPLVILEAAWLILIFKDLHFKSRIINELATSGFTCYLIHSIFLNFINIEKYASGEWYIMFCHVIISVIAIYLCCYVIHKIYNLVFGKFVKFISPKIDKIKLLNFE